MRRTLSVVELAFRFISGGIRNGKLPGTGSDGFIIGHFNGDPNVPMYRPPSVHIRAVLSELALENVSKKNYIHKKNVGRLLVPHNQFRFGQVFDASDGSRMGLIRIAQFWLGLIAYGALCTTLEKGTNQKGKFQS